MSLKLSIIIPVYNSKNTLHSLFKHLELQDASNDQYEVIFVDNGSSDGSYSAIEEKTKNRPGWKLTSYTDLKSSYAARNHGIRLANFEHCAFTDADCQPHIDWIRNILASIENETSNYIIAGEVNLVPQDVHFNNYEWYDKLSSLRQEHYAAQSFGATANLTVHKALLHQLNGFREVTSGGDRDFCLRAKEIGAKFKYNKNIIVDHPSRSTFNQITKKIDRVAAGKAELERDSFNAAKRIRLLASSFFQINQFRMIIKTLKEPEFSILRKTSFSIIALYFGFRARIKQLAFSLRK